MYMYLETGEETGKFNCRGEIGDNDNPEGFIRLMEKSGLRAYVVKAYKGDKNVTLEKLSVKER